MTHKTKTVISIISSLILVIGMGIMCYADNYVDNSAIYVYDADTNPNGNVGLIAYYDEASADTDTMKAYIDAGDSYFANQLASCKIDVIKGKNLLRSALVYKGVSLPVNPTYTQIAQGIANIPAQNTSGTMTITAHFHLDGVGVNKTFTDNATQTAWQQYNAYLNSHNTGETYSGQSGCYTLYYNYHHYHNDNCYDIEEGYCFFNRNVFNMGYGGGDCEHCHRGMINVKIVETHSKDCGHGPRYHEEEYGPICPDQIPSGGGGDHYYKKYIRLKCTQPEGSFSYYKPNECLYTNGKILKIDVIY